MKNKVRNVTITDEVFTKIIIGYFHIIVQNMEIIFNVFFFISIKKL